MKAHEILNAAAGHLADRAKTYDKPEGERSMAATVEAFKAVTGHELTETQGWLFMALLKAVRSQQNAFKLDSYEDGAAYFALAGESASQETRLPGKILQDTIIVKVCSDADTPSWNDAPEWAQWVAQAKGGNWFWFKNKPEAMTTAWAYDGEQIELAFRGQKNPNWRETLEQRPINDGWIQWNGGDRPVTPITIVEVIRKNGTNETDMAGYFCWFYLNTGADIIAYRVIK